ncbi:MAG: glycosyltransferase involved in cell wall biosynthesis [Planctomycetota bacterium]|jgi:glycosyltransferase involved in cell wall biosynthesis
MTIAKDNTGSVAPTQASRITLETDKSFRFLFLGGTSVAAGAEIVVDAFQRAFGRHDNAALIIGAAAENPELLNVPWLAQAFDSEEAPEAELIDFGLNKNEFDDVLAQCDAIFCMGDQARDQAFLRRAVEHNVTVILPESEMKSAGLDHSTSYPVLAGVGAELVTQQVPSVHPQDLAGVFRRVIAEPTHVADKIRLAKNTWTAPQTAEPQGEKLEVTAPDISICWGAAAFNYSGYAKVTRNVLSTLDRHGANFGYHGHGADQNFVDELEANPEMEAYWSRVIANQSKNGVYCSFHPPFRIDGESFYRLLKTENTQLKAIAAVTMFETDRIPAGWAAECNVADEVWVPCQFNIDSFTKGGVDPKKLKKFQLGIDAEPYATPGAPFEIPGRRGFNFLSIFDWALRKGWDVLLRAYFEAFTIDDDVSLTIRAYAAIDDQDPIEKQIQDFMKAEGVDPLRAPKIIMIDRFISEAQMPSLYQAADAFVMPSRGEGWGLPYMEAMAAGLPTIGTRWSGQLEFMNDTNSHLIDLEGLVPVFSAQTRLSPFYESDHLWAQPSTCHLKEIMREVVANPEQAKALGQIAQDDVRQNWTCDHMVQNLYRLSQDLLERKLAEAQQEAPPEIVSQERVPQVAWTGPIYDASGYADEGRNFLHPLIDDGISVLSFPMNWTKRSAELSAAEKDKLVKLESTQLINDKQAVMVQHTLGEILEPSRAGHPCAGRTMFETDSLPANWVTRCNTMNRVWVPSQFNVDSFVNGGVEPHRIRILHPALDVDRFQNIGTPIDFGTGKKVNFLSVFDWTCRKGWDVLLRAWAAEFRPEDDVCLVLKVWSSLNKPASMIGEEIEQFLDHSLGITSDQCAEIMIYDHHIPEDDMPRLYAGADAFVLPTRGEGWGRPIMEAMAAGVITIATNWGGNTEFMDDTNSLPVDYKLTPCSPEAIKEARWFKGHNWAECYEPHLRLMMRRVVAGDKYLPALAAKGREDILTNFDRKTIGTRLRALLVDLAGSHAN